MASGHREEVPLAHARLSAYIEERETPPARPVEAVALKELSMAI
jgi:hypothetical protein